MQDEKRIQTCQRRYYAGTNYRLNKYGYIVVSPMTEEEDALVRKITPQQRKCIILYYIKTHSMKPFKVSFLAKKLGCQVRSIQYDLRYLEKGGYIRRIPYDAENNATMEWGYLYVDAIDDRFFRIEPTIRKLYGKANSLGLREWHWDDYKTIPGMTDEYHTGFDKQENYEELLAKKKKQEKLRDHAEYVHIADNEHLKKRINRYLLRKK